MNQLQTVHDKLEKIACLGNGDTHGNSIGNTLAIECLEIVKQMMQAEPVAFFDKYGEVFNEVEKLLPTDTPLYAAPQAVVAAPQAVPAGFVLVPVEPTTKMLDAMTGAWLVGATSDMALREYKAMLAAAPKGAV